jgi:hypothetical protein
VTVVKSAEVDVPAVELGQESEEDLGQNLARSISSVSLATTDWTTGSILDQLRQNNIDIKPRFQRRDVWSDQRKSRLVESLLLNLPIPQLVLAESREKRGKFIVLDGRQRLLALRRFAAAPGDGFTPLRLKGLRLLPRMNGHTLSDLVRLPEMSDDLAAFNNASLRTVIVRKWPDEDYLRLIFYRLNTESTPLAPMELRQALFPGPFTDFLDEISANSSSLRKALGIEQPDFRMRDAELLLRFLAIDYSLNDYNGNLKDFLDRTCETLNEQWLTLEKDVKRRTQAFETGIDATIAIFGVHAFRTWSNGAYQGLFNRAVFDVMTVYFSRKDVAAAARRRSGAVQSAFQRACGNRGFRESLTTTTKSTKAMRTRIAYWGRILRRTLDVDVVIPELPTVK